MPPTRDATPASVPSLSVRAFGIALLTAIYFVAGKAGLSLAVVNASASAIWPPTGVAVAALLLFGRWLWPGIAIGAFAVNVTTTAAVLPSLVVAAGNTMEAVIAAVLVTRYANGTRVFERSRDVFLFAIAAGLIAPIVSASFGAGVLAASGLEGSASFRVVWGTWWLGDALGAVLYAPALILLWTDRRPRPPREIFETIIVGLSLAAVSWLVFGRTGAGLSNYPLGFLCIPLALWPAFRLGQRETAFAAVLLSVMAVWGTIERSGPYGPEAPNRGLLLAQTFAGVVGITTASMAALVAERRRLYEQLERRVLERTEQLRQANQELHVEIGAREQVQGALRSSEGRLLEAQALAHLGSWEWDIGGSVVRWSAELYRIYGVDIETFEVSYESFISMVHPDDRAPLEKAVGDALAVGGFFETEHRIIRPDGTERVIGARGRTVCDADGRPVRMVGTGQDVTEHKQADRQRRELEEEQSARRQAEAASQLKDEFLAIVSHELRTPLNAILGWAHMLSVGSLDRAGSAKALQIIERNAIMQARLIDDLLDVSRFATSQAFVQAAPVAIASIVRTAVDTIEPVAASRRISLTLSVDDADVVVEGDSARLQQVVSNLLSNALKFTPEGGEVRVVVEATQATVSIAVADSGRGIAPAQLTRVFEPFWQADTTLTRTEGGLGLGLAIVRSLVEAHGGGVRAESDGLGRGARFIVQLPRSAVGAATQAFGLQAG
jgi:PAS domain S-box-containing protein